MQDIYMTDWGEVLISDNESAILAADDYICQRKGSQEGYVHLMRQAKIVRADIELRGKEIWRRSVPAYFWLGAEADAS